MDKRLILFVVLSSVVWIGNLYIQAKFFPPPPKPAPIAKKEDAAKKGTAGAKKDDAAKKPGGNEVPPGQAPVEEQAKEAVVEPAPAASPPRRITLGSLDPESNSRMLVTLTNQGAAVERIELNSSHYHDLDDRSGYLGELDPSDTPKKGNGCLVNVVGPGTPAEKAGIKVGDVIVAFNDKPITHAKNFVAALSEGNCKPGQVVRLKLNRDDKPLDTPVEVTLVRKPLAVIRPEKDTEPVDLGDAPHDPLSLLLTLDQIDEESLTSIEQAKIGEKKELRADTMFDELPGLRMRKAEWEVVADGKPNDKGEPEAAFRYVLAKHHLEIIKRFRLAQVPTDKRADEDYKAYHLVVEVELHNTSSAGAPLTVSYRLDGPTGLPLEGAWYTNKKGIRDVAFQFQNASFTLLSCASIVQGKAEIHGKNQKLDFFAVDAQYFASALLPEGNKPFELSDAYTLFVGDTPPENRNYRGDTSFRLISMPVVLKPDANVKQELVLFAGPKKPGLLEQYSIQAEGATAIGSLTSLVDYGWFPFGRFMQGTIARAMIGLLHIFHAIIPNYGIAILMLTVLVRACMFPISRKQAQGAQKMQLIQPELKRIKEKYKSDAKAQQKATHELFQKHGYNPLSGCLPMVVQMPIFIGLYSGLRQSIDLRQSPLLGEAVHWCSNLAAPDMLFRWDSFMPTMVTRESGMFSLGPYFNLLPCITITLFILQQKLFMPPATDENSAMQQSMMKYMMVFMGFTFYCVPSGLCLYFIMSSIWGIMERILLPRVIPVPVAEATITVQPNKKKR